MVVFSVFMLDSTYYFIVSYFSEQQLNVNVGATQPATKVEMTEGKMV